MKVSRFFVLISIIVLVVSGFSMQAHAALQNLGTDSLGNRLIYDTDLDVTWYDYAKFDYINDSNNTWQNQVDWATGLSVEFGSNTYTDWRLPTIVDGPFVWGYDGTTTGGFNITTSEMGHLFYTELGNEGLYDTSGNLTGCDSGGLPLCLTNTSVFQNLQPRRYWSGTEYSADPDLAWGFRFHDGYQYNEYKDTGFYAIAVMSGKAIVPEPISSTLFIVGGATLGFRRWRKRETS